MLPPVNVARESAVEVVAGDALLDKRRVLMTRVSRWSWDPVAALGPRSGLSARRLDPPALESCDIVEVRALNCLENSREMPAERLALSESCRAPGAGARGAWAERTPAWCR